MYCKVTEHVLLINKNSLRNKNMSVLFVLIILLVFFIYKITNIVMSYDRFTATE